MFGQWLKELREQRGYGQTEFAQMVGVDYSQIWRWETGENEAKRDAIKALAAALDVSTDYLLGLVKEPRGLLAEAGLSPQERRLIHMIRTGDLKKALNTISQMEGGD